MYVCVCGLSIKLLKEKNAKNAKKQRIILKNRVYPIVCTDRFKLRIEWTCLCTFLINQIQKITLIQQSHLTPILSKTRSPRPQQKSRTPSRDPNDGRPRQSGCLYAKTRDFLPLPRERFGFGAVTRALQHKPRQYQPRKILGKSKIYFHLIRNSTLPETHSSASVSKC